MEALYVPADSELMHPGFSPTNIFCVFSEVRLRGEGLNDKNIICKIDRLAYQAAVPLIRSMSEEYILYIKLLGSNVLKELYDLL